MNKNDVISALASHIGAPRGVTASRLVDEMYGHTCPACERQLRAIVEKLRREEGLHICAHPARGYFIAASAEELDETCEFLYRRAMTSLSQVARMKRVSLPELRGQLRILLEMKEDEDGEDGA